MLDSDTILASLEAAAAAGDPTRTVYDLLFAWRPELAALFVRDSNGAVRGEMLARTLEMILDLIGPRAYAEHMLRCEIVTHDGYGVPPGDFPLFFRAVAEGLKITAGDAWRPAYDRAWTVLLAEMESYARI